MEMSRGESGASTHSAGDHDRAMRPNQRSRLRVVDIEDIVLRTAKQKLDIQEKQALDVDHPQIDWSRMYMTHVGTDYVDQHRSPQPSEHVLFTANFSNNTSTRQTFNLTTERRTSSTCNISLRETFTIGNNAELKLTPPNATVVANAGFSTHLSVEKGVNQTFKRELTWTVKNAIEVPPGHVTTAELVIKEDEYNGEFTNTTRFEGKVAVAFKTKNQEDGRRMKLDIKDVLANENGFQIDALGRPCFVTRGEYTCKFGIEQNVLLKESPLPQAVGQQQQREHPRKRRPK